jgi:hypothetical protein
MYGLQAARESRDERAPLLVIGILTDLARHMRWAGHHGTALRLFDLALDQVPRGRAPYNSIRAILWANKAWELASMDGSNLPEARSALGLAFDLQGLAGDDDRLAAKYLMHLRPSVDAAEAELASTASCAYLVLAKDDQRLAGRAEERTLWLPTLRLPWSPSGCASC